MNFAATVLAFLGNAAIKRNFLVTGSFEFFVNHFIHLTAGFNQGSRDNGQ